MSRQSVDPLDYLELDRLLSEEELQVRDRVRSFVRERVLPGVEDWFERGEFPLELATELGELGVLGMHLDGYGCPGGTAVEYGLACTEIEAGDSGLRSFVSVQGSLCMFPIHRYGSEEQKREWLPRMASGEAIGCFALTEPGAGSDPAGMSTFARRDGGDWVLSGHKRWATNGTVSHLAIVWAKTDAGVQGFLVPSDAPGVAFEPIARAWSLRAAARSELFLDEVRLPGEAALPGAIGLTAALACLTEARFGIAWGAMGAARSCYEAALAHAKKRVQFGKPIGAFQLVQAKLVEMAMAVSIGTLLALHLGRAKDDGRVLPEQVSMAKLHNARAALETARTARSLLGAEGITPAFPVIRHMNNLESVVTYEGTEEIHTLIVGHALTGLRAFR